MKRPKITAAGYTRVSTPDQAKEGLSLEDQADRIRAFAEAQGIELAEVYVEAGKSGRKDFTVTRPEFQRLLVDATAGKFGAVIVYEIKRWTRSGHDYHKVKAMLDNAGVALLDVTDPVFDPANPMHQFLRSLKVGMGELQAAETRQRSMDIREGKLNSGHFNIGQRVPYGLMWNDDETALVRDPATYPVWQMIMYLRGQGWGYRRIADALNGRGDVDPAIVKRYGVTLPVENRYGMKVWRDGAIASMFRDPGRYKGQLELRIATARGLVKQYTVPCAPLMTKGEFGRFATLSKQNLTWVPRNVGKGSLLSSLCKCGVCGSTLHVTGSRARPYYGCARRLRRPQKGEQRCTLPIISKKQLESAVMYELAIFLKDDASFKRALALGRLSKEDKVETEADFARREKRLATDARAAQARLDRLVKAVAAGVLGLDDARAERERIQKDQDRVVQRQAELESQREELAMRAERGRQIQNVRAKVGSRIRNMLALRKLPLEEMRDLLRALLPPGSGSCIKIYAVPAGDGNPPWCIEISGLLPMEEPKAEKLKKAVLGGALAVPCTCNPLQQG